MRNVSKLIGGLASLGLLVGLSVTVGAPEARGEEAAEWYQHIPRKPCQTRCSPYDPQTGCWCAVLPPIIITD